MTLKAGMFVIVERTQYHLGGAFSKSFEIDRVASINAEGEAILQNCGLERSLAKIVTVLETEEDFWRGLSPELAGAGGASIKTATEEKYGLNDAQRNHIFDSMYPTSPSLPALFDNMAPGSRMFEMRVKIKGEWVKIGALWNAEKCAAEVYVDGKPVYYPRDLDWVRFAEPKD